MYIDKFYNYTVKLTDENGNPLSVSEPINIGLQLTVITDLNDPLVLDYNANNVNQIDSNNLAEEWDLDWIYNFSGTLNANTSEFSFEFLIPDDNLDETPEYIILESTGVTNTLNEDSTAQFDEIVPFRTIIKISEFTKNWYHLSGPSTISPGGYTSISDTGSNITYTIESKNADGDLTTSLQDTQIKVKISNDLIGQLTIINSQYVAITNVIGLDDLENTIIDVTLLANESSVTFDVVVLPDTEIENEFYKIVIDEVITDFEIPIVSPEIGLINNIKDINSLNFSLNTPEKIVEGFGSDIVLLIKDASDNVLDNSLFDVDCTYSITYGSIDNSASKDDISNFVGNTKTINNANINDLNLFALDDNLIEQYEYFQIALTDVNYSRIDEPYQYTEINIDNSNSTIKIVSPTEAHLTIIGNTNIIEAGTESYILNVKDRLGNYLNIEEDLVVNLKRLNKDAEFYYNAADEDLVDSTISITVVAGTSAVAFDITTTDDDFVEGDEAFILVVDSVIYTDQITTHVSEDKDIIIRDNILLRVHVVGVNGIEGDLDHTNYSNNTINNLYYDNTNYFTVQVRDYSDNIIQSKNDFSINSITFPAGTDSIQVPFDEGMTVFSVDDINDFILDIKGSDYIPTSIEDDIVNSVSTDANIMSITLSTTSTDITEEALNQNYNIHANFTQVTEDTTIYLDVIHDSAFGNATTNSSDIQMPLHIVVPAGSTQCDFTIVVVSDANYEPIEDFQLSAHIDLTTQFQNCGSNILDMQVIEVLRSTLSMVPPTELFENVSLMESFGLVASNEPIIFNISENGVPKTFNDEVIVTLSLVTLGTTTDADFQVPFNTLTFDVNIPANVSSFSFDTNSIVKQDSTAVKEALESFNLIINSIKFLSTGTNTLSGTSLSADSTAFGIDIISPPGRFSFLLEGFQFLRENWSTPYPFKLQLRTPSGAKYTGGDANVDIQFDITLQGFDPLNNSNTEEAEIGTSSSHDVFFSTIDEHMINAVDTADNPFLTENNTGDLSKITNTFRINAGGNYTEFWLNTSGSGSKSTTYRFYKIIIDNFKLLGDPLDVENSIFEELVVGNHSTDGEYWGVILDKDYSTFGASEQSLIELHNTPN